MTLVCMDEVETQRQLVHVRWTVHWFYSPQKTKLRGPGAAITSPAGWGLSGVKHCEAQPVPPGALEVQRGPPVCIEVLFRRVLHLHHGDRSKATAPTSGPPCFVRSVCLHGYTHTYARTLTLRKWDLSFAIFNMKWPQGEKSTHVVNPETSAAQAVNTKLLHAGQTKNIYSFLYTYCIRVNVNLHIKSLTPGIYYQSTLTAFKLQASIT